MKLADCVSSEYSVTILFVPYQWRIVFQSSGVRQGTECIRLLLGDLPPALRDSLNQLFQGKNTNDDDDDVDDGDEDDDDDDDDDDNNNNNKHTNACTHYHICRTLRLLPDRLW